MRATAIVPLMFLGIPLLTACEAPDRGEPSIEEQPAAEEGDGTDLEDASDIPTAGISDEDIQTMAEIYVALSEVQAETDARTVIAESPEEESRIQTEANQEMQAVLEEHGVTIDEYQEMVELLNRDPRAQNRFEQALARMQG
jgi:hypothetical protein